MGWLLAGSRADVPVIDDWVYAWSVEHLLETGRLRVLPFSAIYPLAQVLWGAVFAKIGGFSFVALRLSTVVLSVFGCWAVYLTLRELECRRGTSLLGAFALACDPVFFALSFSFMTDVPFVDVSAIAMYFFVSAIARDRPRRLWVGGACSIAAFLIRPIGIALPLVVVPAALARRDGAAPWRRMGPPIGVSLGAMAALELALPRWLGPLDWASIRQDQLQWVLSISPTTYMVWTIRVVLEAIFPIAPLLLAAVVGWRRALAIGAVAFVLIVPVLVATHEIPSPLPDWQTWSLQDIGARAMIPGDAAASAWSSRVTPVMRGLGLVALASFMVALAGGVAPRPRGRRWPAGYVAVLLHAAVLLAAVHVLWLYNDRYYLVFAPSVAIVAAAAIENERRAFWMAVPLLTVLAIVAITGTRDLLAFNEACADLARQLEASGIPPADIDAGYPVNGWRLYAHPEHLRPGQVPQDDVPFVTSGRTTPFAIVSHPQPGWQVIRTVPLPRATWQATDVLYVVKRKAE